MLFSHQVYFTQPRTLQNSQHTVHCVIKWKVNQ